jgi:hypothetical protein
MARKSKIVVDPVTGLPVLSAGKNAPVLTSREVAEIRAAFHNRESEWHALRLDFQAHISNARCGGSPALPLWGMLLRDITTWQKIILFSGSALCNITSQQIRDDMEDFYLSQRRVRRPRCLIGD